jgi:hypothetical protein
MPKDRRKRTSRCGRGIGLAAALALAATGCRHTRQEVPPERPYIMPGAAGAAGATAPGTPHVGFSSEPPGGNAFAGSRITPGLPGSAEGYAPPPSLSNQPAHNGSAAAAPAEPEPLQDIPPYGAPPGSGGPPRGTMGTPGAPPSPL